MGDWSADLLCCCCDCCACCEVWCCFHCQLARQYNLVTNNQIGCDWPLYCLVFFVPCVTCCFSYLTRRNARRRYAISSTCLCDCCITCFCPHCSHVQILRHMTSVNEFPGACCYSGNSSAVLK